MLGQGGVPVELQVWLAVLTIMSLLVGIGLIAYRGAIHRGEERQVQRDQLKEQQKLVKSFDGMRDDFRQHLESDDERFRTLTDRVAKLEPYRGR